MFDLSIFLFFYIPQKESFTDRIQVEFGFCQKNYSYLTLNSINPKQEMGKNLVIVESPAKAKTIKNYLGEGFEVMSSYGHVRDLPKGNNAIDIDNNFKPTYEISADKKQVVSELKKWAKKAEIVWLATDDDREGEAISWHLLEALGLQEKKTKRIVFREITKSAIQKAIQNPRSIDIDLVNAQQARRVLDRLVGFELSPVLWRKIKTGLSAGRVQSVAVRFVVERERQVEHFKPQSAFKVVAVFDLKNGKTLEATLARKFKTEEEAKDFLEKCKMAVFSIEKLEKKPRKKKPAPPFTTSTLQQQASAKLRYPVAKTMLMAQRLYEAGHITYMRTDSLNLSEEAIYKAASEIKSAYGDKYLKTRHYKTKKSDAQEAHEAIRPTDFSKHRAGTTVDERRLYDLIWKRAIASQMSDAEIEKTVATIDISTVKDQKLMASGEVITFDGFLKVYLEVGIEDDTNHQAHEEDEDTKGMLPPLEVGQALPLNEMTATERFTRPAPRYTEASLVKKLEEMGIGRPSTYAPTISTIQKRGYVIKESRDGKKRDFRKLILENQKITKKTDSETFGSEKNKLFPTDTAMVVNDFLFDHFPNVVDYSFTATVEKEFDEIAHGKVSWEKMIKDFYSPFHEKVENATGLDRSEVKTGRVLGNDPKTGLQVSVRLGRFGPFAQLGEKAEEDDSEENKPKYASLRKGQLMETITLEEALELFKLPRQVGIFEGKVMTAAIGRFGPYIRHDGKFVSLKEHDPHTVDEPTAIELIKTKREADAKKIIKLFPENEEVRILNGRWGPYIAVGKQNVKLSKELKADLEKIKTLTLSDCLKMAEEQEKTAKPKAKKTTKTKAKKATTKKATKRKTATKKTATRKRTTKKVK